MALRKVNLAEAFNQFTDHWSPRMAGDINDVQVKLVKVNGPFHWHHHETEDELFLVVQRQLRMHLRDGDIDLGPNEFLIVPHGVEHLPEAIGGECQLLLLEPNTTLNTGTIENERTVREPRRLA